MSVRTEPMDDLMTVSMSSMAKEAVSVSILFDIDSRGDNDDGNDVIAIDVIGDCFVRILKSTILVRYRT